LDKLIALLLLAAPSASWAGLYYDAQQTTSSATVRVGGAVKVADPAAPYAVKIKLEGVGGIITATRSDANVLPAYVDLSSVTTKFVAVGVATAAITSRADQAAVSTAAIRLELTTVGVDTTTLHVENIDVSRVDFSTITSAIVAAEIAASTRNVLGAQIDGSTYTAKIVAAEISASTRNIDSFQFDGSTYTTKIIAAEIAASTRNILGSQIDLSTYTFGGATVGISSTCAAGQYLSSGTWVDGVLKGGGCVTAGTSETYNTYVATSIPAFNNTGTVLCANATTIVGSTIPLTTSGGPVEMSVTGLVANVCTPNCGVDLTICMDGKSLDGIMGHTDSAISGNQYTITILWQTTANNSPAAGTHYFYLSTKPTGNGTAYWMGTGNFRVKEVFR
jgi:hypothetical protein